MARDAGGAPELLCFNSGDTIVVWCSSVAAPSVLPPLPFDFDSNQCTGAAEQKRAEDQQELPLNTIVELRGHLT
jgi:hypothetical protein